MHKLTSTLLFLFLFELALGQYQIGLVPRISPDKAVSQKIGYTQVKVAYGSPAVNNRQIWGELVPYDKIWRAGANNATTVEFSSKVSLQGMALDSGKYALFMVPKEADKWVVIFNKTHKQWGAFRYKEEEDALRIEVLPKRKRYPTENLTYSLNQVGYKYGSIVLEWEFLEIEIPFETNYLQQFEQEVESRAVAQPAYLKWIVYLQGAEHLLQINANKALAMAWISQAEEIMDATSEWNEQFYPRDYVKGHVYWTKAKLLAQSGDFSQAVAYAEKVKTLDDTIFYDRKKEEEGIEDSIADWKDK